MSNLPKKLIISLFLFSFLFLVAPLKVFSQSEESQAEEITRVKIGVLAKRGSQQAIDQWGPLADYLTADFENHSEADDKRFIFEILPLDFDEINKAVKNKEIDFIITNSANYIELEYLYGVSRIATMENSRLGEGYSQFGGVIFTSKENENKTLKDFDNKTFGATEENSLGGYYAALGEFINHNIEPERFFSETIFLGTHDDVVYAVKNGTIDLGTVRTDTLERMEEEGKVSLEDFYIVVNYQNDEDIKHHKHSNNTEEFPFIHSTDLYPEWPFAKLEHTSNDLAVKTSRALFELPSDSQAAKSANITGWLVPERYLFVSELMQKIKVSPYENYGIFHIDNFIKENKNWIAGSISLIVITVFALLKVFVTNVKFRQSNKKYQDLLDISRAIILELDEVGKIKLINDFGANKLGYDDKTELINLNWFENFIPKENQDKLRKVHKSNFAGRISENREVINTVLTKSGDIIDVKWHNELIKRKKKIIGVFSYGVDITKTKKYEDRLKEKTEKLEQINKVMVNRELKMKELKEEITKLKGDNV